MRASRKRPLLNPAPLSKNVYCRYSVRSRAAGGFDFTPGIGFLEMCARPKLLLRLRLAGQQGVIIQRIELLAAHLDRVLQAVEGRLHDSIVGRVEGAELDEAAAQFRSAHQCNGQRQVAIEFELGSRLQACGRAGMAGNEHQLIRQRARQN